MRGRLILLHTTFYYNNQISHIKINNIQDLKWYWHWSSLTLKHSSTSWHWSNISILKPLLLSYFPFFFLLQYPKCLILFATNAGTVQGHKMFRFVWGKFSFTEVEGSTNGKLRTHVWAVAFKGEWSKSYIHWEVELLT